MYILYIIVLHEGATLASIIKVEVFMASEIPAIHNSDELLFTFVVGEACEDHTCPNGWSGNSQNCQLAISWS